MLSHTDIINIALAKINIDPIVSISPPVDGTEDTRTPTEQQIARIYDLQRKEVLTECPWTFAIKKVAFSGLTSIKASDGRVYYERPADFVDNMHPKPESVLGCVDTYYGYFYYFDFTYNYDGYWYYIFDNMNSAFYSPIFVHILTIRLAGELAVLLTKNIQLKQLYDAEYDKQKNIAVGKNNAGNPFKILNREDFSTLHGGVRTY